jgi:hypothetical protein
MATAEPIELCPRCAVGVITDETGALLDKETGWCLKCSSDAVVEQYVARETEAAYERTKKWKYRSAASDAPDALRERQRKHRLYAAVEPKERPAPYSDPWEIAVQGLRALRKVRGSVASNPHALERIGEAEEAIRQLAVGPED